MIAYHYCKANYTKGRTPNFTDRWDHPFAVPTFSERGYNGASRSLHAGRSRPRRVAAHLGYNAHWHPRSRLVCSSVFLSSLPLQTPLGKPPSLSAWLRVARAVEPVGRGPGGRGGERVGRVGGGGAGHQQPYGRGDGRGRGAGGYPQQPLGRREGAAPGRGGVGAAPVRPAAPRPVALVAIPAAAASTSARLLLTWREAW